MIIPALSNSSAILNLGSSSCNDLHSCRTIWNIIWSSLVTLFACVWLSVHPNIPAPDDSWGKRAARRVWIMLAVLMVPELVVAWATRQWIVASKIAEENKKYGWTKTHGFFVVMGGFMKCDKDGVSTIALDDVDSIPETAKRRILEVDITDKSKGDVLSKTFAVLQTGWFILQCMSRAIEDLPVTELEVATGAFCVLNFATYILWWNKPLNVSHPVRVYADEREGEVAAEGGAEDGRALARRLWGAFKRGLADIPKEAYRPLAAMVEEHGGLVTTVFFPFILLQPILSGKSLQSNSRRVATFGPELPGYADLFMSGTVGVVFGAIHCTAWASQFPSQKEQLFWRVAAISVTGVPLLMMLLTLLVIHVDDSQQFTLQVAALVAIAAAGLYVVARLALLALPFMSLRSLPPGAFITVDWIRFIPHI